MVTRRMMSIPMPKTMLLMNPATDASLLERLSPSFHFPSEVVLTDYKLTEAFLTNCLQQKTALDAAVAAEACAVFLEVSRIMNLITAERIASVERDARVLQLAGQGVPRATIAVRMSCQRNAVFKAIRRHQRARRDALRLAS